MPKCEMLINSAPGEECRIAIVENGQLEEIYQERASSESHVSNIYKGRVMNVEPSIQAAFVDFGLERNGFLHITDLHPMYFPGQKKEESERVGHKTPRRDRPPIQKCLRRGQDIVVQILKEGIGTKGPTLTSYLSIPGRFLVMMPNMERLGVSRRHDDEQVRRETRKILEQLNPHDGFGFIVRTAGVGRNKLELKRDLSYLQRLWVAMEKKQKTIHRVGVLYEESDLVVRTIRDVFTTDIERIIVDDPAAAQRARDYLRIANPRATSKVMVYSEPIPLFRRFGIEEQIENINRRTVDLPSGGSLVIEATEALVAIDVNSGKMRSNRDAETTAYKTNVEAVDEIARQLRLRDLGGVIINDLIDMVDAKHRRAVEQRFRTNLKRDRARTRTASITQFGILEMTRQRMRPSLQKSIHMDCAHCAGTGAVKTAESVVLDVMRQLATLLHQKTVDRVELTISPDVAFQILNQKRSDLSAIEQRYDKHVMVRVNASGPIDFIRIEAFDDRGGTVDTDKLGVSGIPELESIDEFEARGGIEPAVDPNIVFDDVDEDEDEEVEKAEEAEATESDGEGATDAPDAQDGEEEARPKRRRRRRRGGRNRSKRKPEAAEGADSASEDAESSGAEPKAAAGPEADAPAPRRRRKSKTARKQPDAAAPEAVAAAPQAEEASAEADSGNGEPKPKRKVKRRRGRSKKKKKAAGTSTADA